MGIRVPFIPPNRSPIIHAEARKRVPMAMKSKMRDKMRVEAPVMAFLLCSFLSI